MVQTAPMVPGVPPPDVGQGFSPESSDKSVSPHIDSFRTVPSIIAGFGDVSAASGLTSRTTSAWDFIQILAAAGFGQDLQCRRASLLFGRRAGAW